jgi:hypothetical protein
MRSSPKGFAMKTTHYLSAIITVLFLLPAFISHAQIGVKAGFGFSDVVFSDEGQVPYLGYETDYLTHRYPLFTYQVGLFATVRLSNHFDFQPELLFVKQGLNYNMDFIYDDIENRLDLYYLQLPIIIRYRMGLKRKHQPNLFVGPYFGFLIQSKRTKTYDGNTTSQSADNAKPYDFGLVTGFGYDFNLKTGQITAELRFGYSLIDVLETQEAHLPYYNTHGNLKARNLSTTILVGYRFTNLKKK